MRIRLFVLLIVLGVSLAACAGAQKQKDMGPQGVELRDGVIVTATVVGLDRGERTLTLLGPGGNVVTVAVSLEARNYDQVKVGDMLKVEYYESVAIYLGGKNQEPEITGGIVTERAAKGNMPAGVVTDTVDVSTRVRAIDRKKRTVTLELPDGKVVTMKVDKSARGYDNLKVGDMIHARFTEAMAISVERP